MTIPERTGRTATCRWCGATEVPTEWRGGVEVLALHTQQGGEGHCYRGSGQRVRREDKR